jgi:hypothetical protein
MLFGASIVQMSKFSLARAALGLSAGLLLLLIAAWTSGSSGQVCGYGHDGHQENCASYNLAFFFILQAGEIINYYGALITAFATIAIAWFTWTLRNSTERLWIAGERHSERELRAFVFAKAVAVTPHTFTELFTGTHGTWERAVAWTVSIMWENSGGTPTKNMFSHVSTDFFDGEMPGNFTFPDLGDQTRIRTMIGPGAVIYSGAFEYRVEDPRVGEVFKRTKHLYIWGWAEYDDIFENTKRHRTEFCYEVFFVGAAYPNKVQFTTRMHRSHNAADEDCQYPLKTPRPQVPCEHG